LTPIEGHETVLDVLLSSKADLGSRALDGSQALSLAAEGGHLACIHRLIAAKADLESKNLQDNTALAKAVQVGSTAALEVQVQCPKLLVEPF